MTENDGLWHKTENAAKTAWSDVKNSAEFLKEKIKAHHRRAEEEVEFADVDFYEDNIYDEPEYWRSGHRMTKSKSIKH